MINVTRFDPRADYFGNLVDDLFKGFLVRPVTYADRLPASRWTSLKGTAPTSCMPNCRA